MTRPRLLLDTPSLFYRAYFALPTTIRAPHGRPVNAVRGYLDMVARLVVDRTPSAVVHALDVAWQPAWRLAAYPGYKAARRPDPADLPWQGELLREVLLTLGARVAGAQDMEADDVIGTLAAAATALEPAEIVSGDRDLLQLVRDPAVVVLFTVRGVSELHRYDAAAVRERYGVPPERYAEMAILRGDPSDGLPGVRGLGGQTAARLIAEHGDLAGVEAWARAATGRGAAAVAAAADYLAAMRVVVPIVTDAAVDLTPARRPERRRLEELGVEHGIEAPVARLLAALDGSG